MLICSWAQLEVFSSSDYLRVVSPFLCFIMVFQFIRVFLHDVRRPPCELNNFVLQQQQNPGRRFGTSKMHLDLLVAYAAVRSKGVVLLLLTVAPFGGVLIVVCFVVHYFISILVLQ